MTDETKEAAPVNSIFAPAAPAKPDVPKIDHLVEIEALARALHTASPSGAQTISDKILEHVGAIRDPKAHDERVAAEAKTEAEAEATRQKVRDERKEKTEEKVA